MRHSQMAEKTRKAHTVDAMTAKRTTSGIVYNHEQDILGINSVRGTECNYVAFRQSCTHWQGGTIHHPSMTLKEADDYLLMVENGEF